MQKLFWGLGKLFLITIISLGLQFEPLHLRLLVGEKILNFGEWLMAGARADGNNKTPDDTDKRRVWLLYGGLRQRW